tara:strand:+ start:15574 stop:16374 length:801 start_codon:yes stop_codon:yes gene_type:complete
MKMKKILFLILLFVVFTKVKGLYLQKRYPLISDFKSDNYKIVKIDLPFPVGSGIKIGYLEDLYSLSKDPKHILSDSTVYIRFNEKTLNFIVSVFPHMSDVYIINSKGEVIKNLKYEKGDFQNYELRDTSNRNELLLKNLVLWSSPKNHITSPLNFDHFINIHDFDTSCVDLSFDLRSIGSPNGPAPFSPCYIWKGNGCFSLTFNDEVLKFSLPWKIPTYFFSGDHVFPPLGQLTFEYHIPPKEYQDSSGNMAILWMDYELYFIVEK